ncbi:MAG TPA: class II glutamine amidotransferase [Myxococcaceae bacterium]|nr:class II glutamine amidotransferase [Myxococcaceae bacterium]
MCRLYAIRTHAPVDVRDALLTAPNCLRVQSREHPDGWGIATFDGGLPQVVRRLDPAHADAHFITAADPGPTRLLLAHVRQASVGAINMANVHPFVRGRWVFMHNGTLTDFRQHQATIEARIRPELLASVTSTTDSERLFLLFLTLLEERRGTVDGASLEEVAWALSSVMAFVATHTDAPGRERSSMNLLVSDGSLMCITRRGRTLVLSTGPETSGLPESGTPLTTFALASEPPHAGPGWVEVPEETVIGVDAGLTLSRWIVGELAARQLPHRAFG